MKIQKEAISAHRDSSSKLFLKNLFFVLSIPILGMGLMVSYASKNSFSFWKSHGELAVESLEKVISLPLP